ncbi:MAG: hypothetical protein Q8R90_08885 [Bacteroidales bacterium]|nr:hypothetical protein [Bacteroidales bacterium]
MTKQQRKVYHVEFKGIGKHYYFGSLAAIFDCFTVDQIGVEISTFWYDHDFDLAPYQNDKVIVRFGYLVTKEGGRGGKKG